MRISLFLFNSSGFFDYCVLCLFTTEKWRKHSSTKPASTYLYSTNDVSIFQAVNAIINCYLWFPLSISSYLRWVVMNFHIIRKSWHHPRTVFSSFISSCEEGNRKTQLSHFAADSCIMCLLFLFIEYTLSTNDKYVQLVLLLPRALLEAIPTLDKGRIVHIRLWIFHLVWFIY